MIRTAFVLLIVITCSSYAFAQDKTKKVSRPDIPGSFMIDIGLNRGLNKPKEFKQGLWGSRTLNVYYQYPIRFGRSKFSFNPGVGFSFERYKFTNKYTLHDSTIAAKHFDLVNAFTLYPGIKKSQLVANYFEIPLEFRFDSNPADIARSFNVSLGARFGVLMNAHTKLKYHEEGEVKKIKDRQRLGLTDLRYGLSARIGVGGFNWFAFYNMTPLFQKNKGPSNTEMNTLTVGISINGF